MPIKLIRQHDGAGVAFSAFQRGQFPCARTYRCAAFLSLVAATPCRGPLSFARFGPSAAMDSRLRGIVPAIEKEKNMSNKPTHRALGITSRNGRTFWNEIGAAWLREDGSGIDITLVAFPVSGRLTLKPNDVVGDSPADEPELDA